MDQRSVSTSVVKVKQRALLHEVCRFRFVTAELLAAELGLASPSALHRRLLRLVNAGYLGRHYQPTDHLLRQPATYYVTPKSRPLLRQANVPETVLDGIYKHVTASERLQDHCVTVLKVMVQLKQRLGEAVACYPKNDLALYDYLPQPLPDGLIITTDDVGQRSRYLLEVFDATTPRFAIRNRLRYYRDYFEAGHWSSTGLPIPTLHVVCRTDAQMHYTQTVIESLISDDLLGLHCEVSLLA